MLCNEYYISPLAPYKAGTIIIPILLEKIEVNFSKSHSLQEESVLTPDLAFIATIINCTTNCVIQLLFLPIFKSLGENLSLEFLFYIKNKIRNKFSFKNSIVLVLNNQKRLIPIITAFKRKENPVSQNTYHSVKKQANKNYLSSCLVWK